MLSRKAGKDFVVIVFQNCLKALPRKTEPLSRDCGAFLYDLEKCRIAKVADNRQPPELWNDFTQKFNSFGEHVRPQKATPVTLASGRARLVTSPYPTGSADPSMTIGMVVVSCFSSVIKGELPAIRTSGRRDTSSRASAGT